MNFSRMIKDELTEKKPENSCCELSCLSAFLRTSGTIENSGGKIGFSISCENAKTLNYIKKLLEKLYNILPSENVCNDEVTEKNTLKYLTDETASILIDLGILTVNAEGVSINLKLDEVINECCKIAFIKGAFLGGGSATVPKNDGKRKNTGYHIEFIFTYYETANDFCEILSEFDIFPKMIERKNAYVVYLKSSAEIQDLLVRIGSVKSALKLSEIVVLKEVINESNRKKNCDLHNINKQMDAALRQTEAITIISESIGLSSLETPLRVVAELRLDDNTLTLSEMSEKLKITKSCLNHRFRKLEAIAAELKN